MDEEELQMVQIWLHNHDLLSNTNGKELLKEGPFLGFRYCPSISLGIPWRKPSDEPFSATWCHVKISLC